MKKILLILCLILLPSICFAVSLQWNAVTTNTDGSAVTDLAGYNAYNVTGTRTKVNSATIATTVCTSGICTWVLPSTPSEGAQFVVTAIDTGSNESADSNIASYKTTPMAPGSLIIKIP